MRNFVLVKRQSDWKIPARRYILLLPIQGNIKFLGDHDKVYLYAHYEFNEGSEDEIKNKFESTSILRSHMEILKKSTWLSEAFSGEDFSQGLRKSFGDFKKDLPSQGPTELYVIGETENESIVLQLKKNDSMEIDEEYEFIQFDNPSGNTTKGVILYPFIRGLFDMLHSIGKVAIVPRKGHDSWCDNLNQTRILNSTKLSEYNKLNIAIEIKNHETIKRIGNYINFKIGNNDWPIPYTNLFWTPKEIELFTENQEEYLLEKLNIGLTYTPNLSGKLQVIYEEKVERLFFDTDHLMRDFPGERSKFTEDFYNRVTTSTNHCVSVIAWFRYIGLDVDMEGFHVVTVSLKPSENALFREKMSKIPRVYSMLYYQLFCTPKVIHLKDKEYFTFIHPPQKSGDAMNTTSDDEEEEGEEEEDNEDVKLNVTLPFEERWNDIQTEYNFLVEALNLFYESQAYFIQFGVKNTIELNKKNFYKTILNIDRWINSYTTGGEHYTELLKFEKWWISYIFCEDERDQLNSKDFNNAKYQKFLQERKLLLINGKVSKGSNVLNTVNDKIKEILNTLFGLYKKDFSESEISISNTIKNSVITVNLDLEERSKAFDAAVMNT